MSYIQLTSPLTLHADPVQDLHPVTKQYVDAKAANADAGAFVVGTIDAARLPAVTGDVMVAAGSNNIALAPTGVVAGNYAKVLVDSAGRVREGAALAPEDIEAVNWSSITSGKPTTAAGYGIANVVPLSGGTVTGAVTSTATPSQALHAVTKEYVDSTVTGVVSGTLSPGDVVRKPLTSTPSGFLRCNGAQVSKTTYAGLYSVIGDTYEQLNHAPGAGKPWKQLYQIDTEATTTLGTLSNASLPTSARYSQAIVTKNRAYLLGGQNSYIVRTAPILSDGTLGNWSTASPLPDDVWLSQAIVTKNRVYLLGGRNTGVSSAVYTAPILSDGTLGSWSTASSLPTNTSHSQAIVTKNRVYLLGGSSNGGNASSTVYTAPILSDGTLGSWSTASPLPAGVSESQAIVTKNRVYLLGGINSSGNPSTVYTAPILYDGTLGSWSTASPLPTGVYGSQAIVTHNRVYLLGGLVNGSYSYYVYTAPILSDGTLGSWSTASYLPDAFYHSLAIVTKNRVYLLGGSSSDVYTASINCGLNDYSPYYDGSIVVGDSDPSLFRLPDFTLQEKNNVNYFIKY